MEVVASVIAYSLCSGTLVLLNKLTLHHLPYPSLVVCVQLVFTLAFIGAGKLSGALQVDPLKVKFVVPYLFYIVLFRYEKRDDSYPDDPFYQSIHYLILPFHPLKSGCVQQYEISFHFERGNVSPCVQVTGEEHHFS
jgi:hypothetical protein